MSKKIAYPKIVTLRAKDQSVSKAVTIINVSERYFVSLDTKYPKSVWSVAK